VPSRISPNPNTLNKPQASFTSIVTISFYCCLIPKESIVVVFSLQIWTLYDNSHFVVELKEFASLY
jgi:hypothetical protein